LYTGRGERIRTSGLFVPNEANAAQKSPKIKGETDPAKNIVTQNVTHDPENVTRAALLEALKDLPKETILDLLAEALRDR